MSEQITGWVKLYHSTGAQVTLPVPDGTPAEMFAFVSECIQAGWMVDLPGVGLGEHKEVCKWIARRVKINDDGTDTPIIDIYTDGKFKFVTTYLNGFDEQEAFQTATGLKLEDVPTYEGQAAIEKGKTPALDKKYILPVNATFIWKDNPNYKEGEMKPKKLFVCWFGVPIEGNLVQNAENKGGVVTEVDGKKPAPMTLEEAEALYSTSHKKPYGELTMKELNGIKIGCQKLLKDDTTAKDDLPKYQKALTAANLVIRSRIENPPDMTEI